MNQAARRAITARLEELVAADKQFRASIIEQERALAERKKEHSAGEAEITALQEALAAVDAPPVPAIQPDPYRTAVMTAAQSRAQDRADEKAEDAREDRAAMRAQTPVKRK